MNWLLIKCLLSKKMIILVLFKISQGTTLTNYTVILEDIKLAEMYLFLFTLAQLDDIFISQWADCLYWRLFIWAGLKLGTKKPKNYLQNTTQHHGHLIDWLMIKRTTPTLYLCFCFSSDVLLSSCRICGFFSWARFTWACERTEL